MTAKIGRTTTCLPSYGSLGLWVLITVGGVGGSFRQEQRHAVDVVQKPRDTDRLLRVRLRLSDYAGDVITALESFKKAIREVPTTRISPLGHWETLRLTVDEPLPCVRASRQPAANVLFAQGSKRWQVGLRNAQQSLEG